MTDTQNTTPEDRIYPTRWVPVDVLADDNDKIECRQVSDDTFQLRSATNEITINKEGFDFFRGGSSKEWNKWLRDNNIESVPRTDLNAES